MPPTTRSAVAADMLSKLVQTAIVYAEDQTTGQYTTVINSALRCLMTVVGGTYTDRDGRAELMALRDFYFDPSYVMPESAQISVNGLRWQPEAGTFQLLGNPLVPIVRKCSIVRLETAPF